MSSYDTFVLAFFDSPLDLSFGDYDVKYIFSVMRDKVEIREINAVFSVVSLSHQMRGTSLGQRWDKSRTFRKDLGRALWISLCSLCLGYFQYKGHTTDIEVGF